jgi:hypothetical protein
MGWWVKITNLTCEGETNLIQSLLNFLKLLWGEFARMQPLDFSAKVLEIGSICGGRKR